ncbi:hypothetical protein TELCIR_26099, partial [Teladorsagia circumcincta]
MDMTAFWTVLFHEFNFGRTTTEATTNVNLAWEQGTASERTGLIQYSFLPPGQTIIAQSYCDQLHGLYVKIERMQPVLANRYGPLVLHDNARPYVSQIVFQELNELGIEVLPHPPYSPDLAPTDFHFFKHLDNFLKNRVFKDQDD